MHQGLKTLLWSFSIARSLTAERRSLARRCRYTKKVKLECKVPIQFEFDIRPLTPGGASLAAVSVAPASGFVPADGAVEVEVSFRPLRLVTYVEQFLVTVSQFNSEPLTCTVTGARPPQPAAPASQLRI